MTNMKPKFIIKYATATTSDEIEIEAKNLSAAKMLIRKHLDNTPANIWIYNADNHLLSSSIFKPRNIHQTWKDSRDAEPCYLRPGDHVIFRKDRSITGIVDRREEQYVLTYCYIVLSIKIDKPESLSDQQLSKIVTLDKYGILRVAEAKEWSKLWHDSDYSPMLTRDVLEAEYETMKIEHINKEHLHTTKDSEASKEG